MWPLLLDSTKQECLGVLRRLELDAYSAVIDALRAGGELTEDKKAVLADLAKLLSIPVERHKSEVRRAINDELLRTVSFRVVGPDKNQSWLREGRRIIPLLPRARPITELSQAADKAASEAATRNSSLPPPNQTKSLPPPPRLSGDAVRDLFHSPPPDLADLVKMESPEVQQNGKLSPDKEPGKAESNKTPDQKSLQDEGFVVLPSGMAVRLKEEQQQSGGRRGKRKRSASKCIEVYPGGVPEPSAATPKRRDSKSPASSKFAGPVQQAGHGYARMMPPQVSQHNISIAPPYSAAAASRPITTANSSAAQPNKVATTASEKVVIMPEPAVPTAGFVVDGASGQVSPYQGVVSPAKRVPVRPAGSQPPPIVSPMPVGGTVYQTSRGRPKLSPSPRPRVVRPRVPRHAIAVAPAPTVPIAPPHPAVRGMSVSLAQALRPPGPRSTTIQLKEGGGQQVPCSPVQGLKVISHSTTKIVPKSATAVYVVPGGGARPAVPSQRLVTVNTGARLSSPRPPGPRLAATTNAGVIRAVRAPRLATPGKPSVIVVQKGPPPSSRGVSQVALYRPAKAVATPRLGTVATGGVVRVPAPRPAVPVTTTTNNSSNNVIVLDLSQDQPNSALANILSASGILSQDGQTVVSSSEQSQVGRKIFVQSSAGGTEAPNNHSEGVWFQMDGGDAAAAAEGCAAKAVTAAMLASTISTVSSADGKATTTLVAAAGKAGTAPQANNLNDLFAAGLEQNDIQLDSNSLVESISLPLTTNQQSTITTTITTLAGRPVTSTTGRLVTLPHRPTFAKASQPQPAARLPLCAPPEDVMPQNLPASEEAGKVDKAETIDDISAFLSTPAINTNNELTPVADQMDTSNDNQTEEISCQLAEN